MVPAYRVLILGARGMLGSDLCRCLEQDLRARLPSLRLGLAFEVFVRVLDHHDRGIHHCANRNRDPT